MSERIERAEAERRVHDLATRLARAIRTQGLKTGPIPRQPGDSVRFAATAGLAIVQVTVQAERAQRLPRGYNGRLRVVLESAGLPRPRQFPEPDGGHDVVKIAGDVRDQLAALNAAQDAETEARAARARLEAEIAAIRGRNADLFAADDLHIVLAADGAGVAVMFGAVPVAAVDALLEAAAAALVAAGAVAAEHVVEPPAPDEPPLADEPCPCDECGEDRYCRSYDDDRVVCDDCAVGVGLRVEP